jgi:serine/threonine protein kinase
MDRVRAKRIVSELSGKALGAWPVGKLIDNGKSALVVETKDQDGQKAALKIFDPDLVEEAGQEVQLTRIQREKSLIGKHHPHLIKILDGGQAEDVGYFFVVMEFCPGETVASALKRIPAENIRTILSQVASAARFLEERTPPLAHRDIKPENVRLKDDLRCAVLLDLGVTKPIGDPGATDQASKHPFLGTRRYSSPSFLRRQEKNTVEGWRAVTFYQLAVCRT